MDKPGCEALLYDKFNCAPYFGRKQFRIEQSQDDRPRALVDDELGSGKAPWYRVALSCNNNNTEPCRFTYQYAHELAHFWLNPLVYHPFFEVVATAISLFALSHAEGPHPGKAYRDKVLQETNVTLAGKRGLPLGLRSVFPKGLKISAEAGEEHVFAANIFCNEILETYPNWHALSHLSYCVVDDQCIDFDKWLQRCHDPLVVRTATVFQEFFGQPRYGYCIQYLIKKCTCLWL